MSQLRSIDPVHARRLIISKQHLDAQARPSMLEVIRDLGCLQLDPISKVARTHLLVLWSRLGEYDVNDFERLRWQDRSLFEYWAHAASIVLTEDYPIHAVYMQQNRERREEWLEEHELQELRLAILREIQTRGTMLSREFEDKQHTEEHFSGWTSNRSVNRLLGYLWTVGEIMVTERKGNQKAWGTLEKFLPDWTPRDEISPYEASKRSIEKAVKALGLARGKAHINYHYTRGRYWDYEQALQDLLDSGTLQKVQVDSWDGDWLIHQSDLALLEKIESGDWQGRTTLLSPFDNLICDRQRTQDIWDFYFRIEIYVPKAKREYGYYVLPILHGDKLIGRMDLDYQKKAKCLQVNATYAESHAPAEAAPAIHAAVESLGRFLGAKDIRYGETMPAMWSSLRA